MAKSPRPTTHAASDNDANAKLLRLADPRAVLCDHQADIEAAIALVSRRERLTQEDSEDLSSEVWIKLLQGSRRVLGAFRGQSSLRTYLVSLVRNLLLDQRTKVWGKWRPCVAARRSGDVAVQLDRLVYRDGYTIHEAAEYIATHRPAAQPHIEEARAHLTRQPRPRVVAFGAAPETPARNGAADVLVRNEERARRAVAAREALMKALAQLSDDERELLYLRFVCGKTLADISKERRAPQKALYRRFDRLIVSLRARLEALGVSATLVGDLTATGPGEWGGIIGAARPLETSA